MISNSQKKTDYTYLHKKIENKSLCKNTITYRNRGLCQRHKK